MQEPVKEQPLLGAQLGVDGALFSEIGVEELLDVDEVAQPFRRESGLTPCSLLQLGLPWRPSRTKQTHLLGPSSHDPWSLSRPCNHRGLACEAGCDC